MWPRVSAQAGSLVRRPRCYFHVFMCVVANACASGMSQRQMAKAIDAESGRKHAVPLPDRAGGGAGGPTLPLDIMISDGDLPGNPG